MSGKQLPNLVFRHAEWHVAYIDFFQVRDPCVLTCADALDVPSAASRRRVPPERNRSTVDDKDHPGATPVALSAI
jgi:hypothetical protein